MAFIKLLFSTQILPETINITLTVEAETLNSALNIKVVEIFALEQRVAGSSSQIVKAEGRRKGAERRLEEAEQGKVRQCREQAAQLPNQLEM